MRLFANSESKLRREEKGKVYNAFEVCKFLIYV